jgi:outer membrane immunogenic protein
MNRQMKKLLLTSTFLVASIAAAAAADAVIEEVPVAVTYDWTGAYIGAHVGYAWANTTVTELDFYSFSSFGDTEFDFDSDGIIGGVHAGYNWQSGQFVYGVEADIAATDIDNTVDNTMIPGSGETFSTNIDWFGTLRGRLGYAVDRFLPYVTGGVAFGDIESSYNDPLDDNFAVASDTVFGWTIGAGAEYALTDQWSLRAEYLYVDLEDSRGSFFDGADEFRYDFDNDLHVVRVGASYNF